MTLDLCLPPLPTTVELSDVRPFVKWAGGKRQLMKRIEARLPEHIFNYHEPFLGGGAVFYHLLKTGRIEGKAYLSDLIQELIDAYLTVRDQPERLMDLLSNHVMFVNSAENFYEIRSQAPLGLEPLARAARMIFLNKTCFNGLYRVNKKGGFNVAYNKEPGKSVFNRANILGASWALQKAEVQVADFEWVIGQAGSGDFVFLDPPHWGRYVSYTGSKFDWADQVRLLNTCSRLDDKRVNWMVSNADHEDIWELWKDFNVERVSVKHMISCNGKGRTGKSEVLITNYEVKT